MIFAVTHDLSNEKPTPNTREQTMEPQPPLPSMPEMPPFDPLPAAPPIPPMPAPPQQAADPFASFDAALQKELSAALAGGLDAVEALATPPVPPPPPVASDPAQYTMPGVAVPPVPGSGNRGIPG